MVKIFEHIKYDLSQNLVKLDIDLLQNLLFHNFGSSANIPHIDYEDLSLCNHSLILTISHVYKDSEIVETIKKMIDSLEDPNNFTNNDILKMKELESKATKKFKEYRQSKSINKDIKYKFQIRNVLMQIFDFLIKGVRCNSVHVNIYLRNIIFTNQGTINMKKTILHILKEPCLSPTSKFEVACYYFIDDSTIRNLYYTDKSEEEEEEEIYFTSNTKFITDYYLYYWEWQIRGTRRLVTEASNFYLQSRSPWSRADIQSDVAILIIFQKAIEENNELAVQYLWTNHISKMPKSEDKLSDAIRLVVYSATKVNTCLFLIFQIQKNELKILLKEISFVILKNMIKNVRWHNLFIKIFDELKIYLSSEAVSELLSSLVKSHKQDYPIGITYDIFLQYLISIQVSGNNRFIIRS